MEQKGISDKCRAKGDRLINRFAPSGLIPLHNQLVQVFGSYTDRAAPTTPAVSWC